MRRLSRKRLLRPVAIGAALATTSLLGGPAAVASATATNQMYGDHGVFVQTNNPSGNQIVAYDRDGGALHSLHTYDTGGIGASIPGAVVDKLASQGALGYDAGHHVLAALNAGSGTVTTFKVKGDRLTDRNIVSIGSGSIPVSVSIHDDIAYVLDASGAGRVVGLRLDDGRLRNIAGSQRSLDLVVGVQPAFLNTPAQVGFTPDGRHLIVTSKANGSDIDVFDVQRNGLLSSSPVKTTSATPVPFGFVFDKWGHLVVGEAGTSSLSTYTLNRDDTVTSLASLTDSQKALCWITNAGKFFYVANAGSATLSGYTIDHNGQPSLIGLTGVVASTDGGPIDIASTPDGSFVYAQTGANGIIDGFRVNVDGSLTAVGTVGGLGVNQIEGIVAS